MTILRHPPVQEMVDRGPHRSDNWSRQVCESCWETLSPFPRSPWASQGAGCRILWHSGLPHPRNAWSGFQKCLPRQACTTPMDYFDANPLLSSGTRHSQARRICNQELTVWKDPAGVLGEIRFLWAAFCLPVSSFISILIFRASAPQQRPVVLNSWFCCVFTRGASL